MTVPSIAGTSGPTGRSPNQLLDWLSWMPRRMAPPSPAPVRLTVKVPVDPVRGTVVDITA